ncbi:putative serine/threonine-protein kinase CST [Bienertia sinuspersici]
MGNCWGSQDDISSNPIINTPPDAMRGGARVGPPEPEVGRIIKPDPKVYTFSELKSATRNFRPDSVLGEGGFGRVYKGWIDKTTLAPSKVGVGIPVAVKKCNADSAQGLKEWKTEINFLGKFSHPNLVRLIGYCWEDKELLLVYEYLNKGSLESHLFQKNVDPPSWSTRISIAMDAARGLDFLHTSENKVIYRDFKAANVLLDENYVAKLSDFGLARLGPPVDKSHVTTQAVGTYGYAAPEYINTEIEVPIYFLLCGDFAEERWRKDIEEGEEKGEEGRMVAVTTNGVDPSMLVRAVGGGSGSLVDVGIDGGGGHLYVRSDVYGFGVVMLEMITGLRAYDLNRPSGQTSLVDWYKPMLSEKSKLKKIIDPRMEEYPPEGINKLAQLILRCLQNDPKNRPPMSEVVMILERISTIRMNPKSSKPSSSKSKGHGNKPRHHSYHPSPAHQKQAGGSGTSPRPKAHRHTHG